MAKECDQMPVQDQDKRITKLLSDMCSILQEMTGQLAELNELMKAETGPEEYPKEWRPDVHTR